MKIFLFLLLIISLICCRQNDEEIVQNTNSYDVYVAGTENNKACYWKNNVKTDLPNGNNIIPEKIIVNNNDVYTFGFNSGNTTNFHFWKNNVKYDVAQYLNVTPNTSASTNIKIVDFKVYNNDIYLLGYVKVAGTTNTYEYSYWKNGTKTILYTQAQSSLPNGTLTLHNNSIYVTSLRIPSFETGYYRDNVYTTISTNNNLLIKGMEANSNGIFILIYDQILQNSYYKNITTNIDLYPMSGSKNNVIMDNSDIYSNIDGSNYVKNGASQSFNINDGYMDFVDMKVTDQKQFLIKKKITQNTTLDISYRVYINGIQTQETTEIANNNLVGGKFASIFVVKN
ncbi:hypothetical protein [Chryseobacterium sp. M5A1_1a]